MMDKWNGLCWSIDTGSSESQAGKIRGEGEAPDGDEEDFVGEPRIEEGEEENGEGENKEGKG